MPKVKPKVLSILGTRPEIVKFSPLLPLLDRGFNHRVIHTGQHYDANMDAIFFKELRLRPVSHQLKVGGLSPSAQIGKMLEGLELIFSQEKPDWVLILGDTNTALAGGLAAVKAGIKAAHIESGCRSFERSAPEEQNRKMLDHICDLLFTPDREAERNLRSEGLSNKRSRLVGSTGLDATRRIMKLASANRVRKFGVNPNCFVLATVHRAESTANADRLSNLIESINEVASQTPVLFPVHPRTNGKLKQFGIELSQNVKRLDPLGSLDFIALLRSSLFVMSDSGGIQEEAAVVNRPCVILRNETEWMRLVKARKNFLAGTNSKQISKITRRLLRDITLREKIASRKAPLEFGASQKIAHILSQFS